MPNPKEKVIVFLPAYFAAKTLTDVYHKIPKEYVDDIVLVDDASNDGIELVAKQLGIKFYANSKNLGYGGNLKVCMRKSLDLGADILIELHPDDQYDPLVIPEAIRKMQEGYGFVTGSRFTKFGDAIKRGMPVWKYIINQLSGPICWLVLGVRLSDNHCGFRVYHRSFLEKVNFEQNDNAYLFAFQIVLQAVLAGVRITEIPVACRYYPNVTQINLKRSFEYGIGVLKTIGQFMIARLGWRKAAAWLYPKELVLAKS